MKISDKRKDQLKATYGAWAVVTGASSGIGQAIAHELASCGFHLIINGRNATRLTKLSHDWEQKFEVQVISIAADVSTSSGVDKIINASEGRHIGLFVPSAGFGTSGSFLTSSIQEEINLLRVNNEAVLRLVHYFAQRFAHQNRGGIVFLSSIVAFQGVPFSANYAASKAYIQSLAEALGHELKPHGVDVLSVAPAPVHSGFAQRANMNMSKALLPQDLAAPILNALGRKTLVLPGALTKVLTYALRTVPRWMKVRIMKMVMRGFTQHQGIDSHQATTAMM